MIRLTEKQKEALRLMGDAGASDIMLYGGSRSGKTFIDCYAVAVRALKYAASRHAILRFRFNHVKQSVWYDTWPKMMRLCFPEVTLEENKSDWFQRFPNGSEVWFGGLDDKQRVEKILGNEYSTLYFNECSQISAEAKNMALTRLAQKVEGCRLMALYDCNPPGRQHWTYREFVGDSKRPRTAALLMNPGDNMANLPADYIQRLEGLPMRQRMRFLHGQFLAEVEGALWKMEWIDKARMTPGSQPESIRIAIGVDPAASTGTHGIVVCATDGHSLYVLEDCSLTGSPSSWANAVRRAYEKWQADAIVVEVNQGGDMAVQTLRQVLPDAPIRKVRAAKGKLARAEPISAFYELGRAFHCGDFPELEEQMTMYTGEPGESSPDRMDALVWAASYLMLKQDMVQDDNAMGIFTSGGLIL